MRQGLGGAPQRNQGKAKIDASVSLAWIAIAVRLQPAASAQGNQPFASAPRLGVAPVTVGAIASLEAKRQTSTSSWISSRLVSRATRFESR